MHNRESFESSKACGDRGEDFLAAVLRPVTTFTLVLGGRDQHDVVSLLGGRLVSAEVKHDRAHRRTGNVAIEFWNSGCNPRPSGISSTSSRLWAFVVCGDDGFPQVWVAASARLAELVRGETAGRRLSDAPVGSVRLGVGDRNADIVLYPAAELFAWCFTRLDGLGPDELLRALSELLDP